MVAEICRRLDGIALAIEFAASRVAAYGIRGTADLLDHRSKPLWRGRRSAPPRHQTLQAMLDWSYNLLPKEKKAILCRLSVFVGPFNPDGALSVAGDTEAPEAVVNLVSKSPLWSSVARSQYQRE